MRRHLKKPTANPPAKQAKPHIQLSSSDLDSIINSVISPSVPSTPTPSPSKRKNMVVVSDDDSSGLEIIEGPHPSPKKKTKPSSSRPGAAAFELPRLSIPDVIQEAARPGPDVTFGTTGRPSRSKVKTEKAVFLEELKTTRKTRAKATARETPGSKDTLLGSPVQLAEPATPSAGLNNGAKKSDPNLSKANDQDVEMSSPIVKDLRKGRGARGKGLSMEGSDMSPSRNQESPKTPGAKAKIPSAGGGLDDSEMRSPRPKDAQPKRASRAQGLSDDELPEVSDLMLSTPKKKIQSASDSAGKNKQRPPLASMVETEAIESDCGSEKSDQGSDRYLATDDDGSVGYQTDDAGPEQLSDHEGENAVLSDNDENIPAVDASGNASEVPALVDPSIVMSVTYQDARLTQFYENLPHLENFKPIEPFAQNATLTSARFSFSKVAPTLSALETQATLKGLLFTQSGFFVNFARIHPKFLQHDSKYIRMARADNAIAVGLFTGLCTKGMIFGIDQIGRPQSLNDVHGVSVAAPDQDTRRYMTLINTVLGKDKITGNASRLGMSFYTRGLGKNGNFGATMAPQPVVEDDEISPFISSVAMPGSAATMRGFPSSRSFDDRIPVYDGRAKSGRQFTFSDADFQELSSWPRYKGEIERDAIVSVGHTVGIYEGLQRQCFLSTNVQFVIILGKPAIGL